MSAPFVKGAQSRRGVNVDPARIRQARLDRGLSLAQLAGNDLSRAFIHQLEHGQSKPSRDTLQLIARRTGKPIGYFTRGAPAVRDVAAELAANLSSLQRPLRTIAGTAQLKEMERQTLEHLEVAIRQGTRVLRAVTRERD